MTTANTRSVHPSPAIVYLYAVGFLGLLAAKGLFLMDTSWSVLVWRGLVVIGSAILLYQYLARVTSVYSISPLEVSTDVGILSKQHDSAPLNRVTNFRIERPLVQRLLGQANLLIDTAGGSSIEIELLEMRREDAVEFARILSQQLGEQKVVEAGGNQKLAQERAAALAKRAA